MKAPSTTAPAAPASMEAALAALDTRARAVYEAVREAVTAHGYPPSMREIGATVGLTSLSSVKHQLDKLERLGLVRRDPNRPRALEVIMSERPDGESEAPPPRGSRSPVIRARCRPCRAWSRARPSPCPSSARSRRARPSSPSRASRTSWRCPGA